MDRSEGKSTNATQTVGRRDGPPITLLWLLAGPLTLGLTSGCVSYAPPVSHEAMEAYLMGQTDEIPPGLPPEVTQQLEQSRSQLQQEKQVSWLEMQKSTSANAEAQRDSLRLPEGYSDPVSDAMVSRSVVVTAAGSADFGGGLDSTLAEMPEGVDGALMAKLKAGVAVQKERAAAAEHREASSAAGAEGRRRYARIRAVQALLKAKVFRQILPTEDPSSPLVTEEALRLHIDQTTGMEMKQSGTMMVGMHTERWSGVLRDASGKRATFAFKVAHPLDGEAFDQANVEALRQQEARKSARIAEALGPAIVKCYGEMR